MILIHEIHVFELRIETNVRYMIFAVMRGTQVLARDTNDGHEKYSLFR